MKAHVEMPPDRIAAFCKRWQILELALFGSVLRDDFGPESDIDVLVRFDPEVRHTLLDIVEIQDDLSSMLGHRADLVEPEVVEHSRNYIRREAILRSAETIYAARRCVCA